MCHLNSTCIEAEENCKIALWVLPTYPNCFKAVAARPQPAQAEEPSAGELESCPVCGGDEELFLVMVGLLENHGYKIVVTGKNQNRMRELVSEICDCDMEIGVDVTQEMLNSGVKAAVRAGLIPEHAGEIDYLNNWNGIKAVISAALRAKH